MITKFKLFEYTMLKEPQVHAGDIIKIHDDQVYLDKREVMILTEPYIEYGHNSFSNDDANWYVDFVDMKTKEKGVAIFVQPVYPKDYTGSKSNTWVFYKWNDPFKIISN